MAKSTIKLSAARDTYLKRQEARQKARTTVDADWMVLNLFIRVVGDMQVASLTPEHVEKFFYGAGGVMGEHESRSNGVETRGSVAPATHNHYRSRLKCFFTWCYEQGYLRRDHLMTRVDPMKVQRKNRQRPSPVALLGLLEAAVDPRDRAFIATVMNTALRSNEIVRYRISDVDLNQGVLYTIISKTKSADEQPITSDLDTELRRWLVIYAEKIGRPLEPDDHLFPARLGGQIMGYDENRQPIRAPKTYNPRTPIVQTYKVVQAVLSACGLPTKGEGCHTIRRAVARAYYDSVAQDKGDVAALRETAALLHHSSIATTEGYLGTSPERESRDRRLKGRPFLSAMVSQDNVVQLRPAATGE